MCVCFHFFNIFCFFVYFCSGEKNDSGINYEKCLEKIENFVVSITQGDKLTDISGQKIAAISIFFYRAEHAGFASNLKF